MFRFPNESQLDSKDCGPACIKILAKFYGKYYSLQYLRDLSGLSREGVSLLDLSDSCEHIGLRTLCVKISWNEFLNFPNPSIVHWKGNHFIVVYKITKKNIHVSDPARGLVKYSHREFKTGWLSNEERWYVLGVEPMSDFLQRSLELEASPKSVRNFLNYFKPYKTSFINLLAVMLIVSILEAFLPFMTRSVIDIGIQSSDLNFINLVFIANIIILISILISNVVRDWILLHITSRVNVSLISDYLIKLMRLPVSFFENKLIGDILQRLNDHDRIRSFFMNNSLNFFFSVITILIFSIILFVFSPTLCLIFCIGNVLQHLVQKRRFVNLLQSQLYI